MESNDSVLQYKMKKVAYLYNQSFSKFTLPKQHPMKPMRLQMVNSLIQTYNLTQKLEVYHSELATPQQLCLYHDPNYINYLQTWVNPQTTKVVSPFYPTSFDQVNIVEADLWLSNRYKVNQGFDCPGFQGLFNYSQMAAGSSIDAANLIISGLADIVINWMGGFHHAKTSKASGFCYVNDIVLCILQLLKVYPRVLYLDIDVHHGDGVEQAFYDSNRVMTVSFHQYQKGYFPYTGGLKQIGQGIGKYFSVNVPLAKGMDDNSYIHLFKRVMRRACESFRPHVIVVQCGADSLSMDQLGQFNLSIKGHGDCLKFMKNFNLPLILLGGGGYTVPNVARCWTYETGLMLNEEIQDQIPEHNRFRYFYGDGKIHYQIKPNVHNFNGPNYLDSLYQTICENLRYTISPSVPFHDPAPLNKRKLRQSMMQQEQGNERF